jgi:hypothetical protein
VLALYHVPVAKHVQAQPFEDLCAPAAVGEGVGGILRVVHVRHVCPALVEAGLPLLVQAVVYGDVVFAGAGDELV